MQPAGCRAGGTDSALPRRGQFPPGRAVLDVGNGVLHFDYDWDSSTGNLANLNNCQVGESVAYPGASPYVWSSLLMWRMAAREIPPCLGSGDRWCGAGQSPSLWFRPALPGGRLHRHPGL